MFCPKCGTQVPDDAKFCPNCGNKFEQQNVAVNPETTPETQPVPQLTHQNEQKQASNFVLNEEQVPGFFRNLNLKKWMAWSGITSIVLAALYYVMCANEYALLYSNISSQLVPTIVKYATIVFFIVAIILTIVSVAGSLIDLLRKKSSGIIDSVVNAALLITQLSTIKHLTILSDIEYIQPYMGYPKTSGAIVLLVFAVLTTFVAIWKGEENEKINH